MSADVPREREVDRVFLMTDLSGYTALTEAHGAREAMHVVSRYVELARAALAPGAEIVERVGDELLIVAPDVPAAMLTALRLRGAVEREPLFPSIRAGMHAGAVLEHEGKYYGAALNLTARVTTHARAGQILCTAAVAAQARAIRDLECRELGPVRFRNIAEPVSVFELVPVSHHRPVILLDPVCRMQLTLETAVAQLTHDGRVYRFCSSACADRFAERPDDYLRA